MEDALIRIVLFIYKIRRFGSVYTQLEIIVRAYNTNIEINGSLKVGKKQKKMALNLCLFLFLFGCRIISFGR